MEVLITVKLSQNTNIFANENLTIRNWFLIFLFWSCLYCISVSKTARVIFIFNFYVSYLIATFTLANVGIKYSLLQVLIKLMSSCICVCLLTRSSNFLATQRISFPCFFLIGRNMLTQAYNFIINKITRRLNIFFCKENKQCYYFPFIIYSGFTFQRPSSEWHHLNK